MKAIISYFCICIFFGSLYPSSSAGKEKSDLREISLIDYGPTDPDIKAILLSYQARLRELQKTFENIDDKEFFPKGVKLIEEEERLTRFAFSHLKRSIELQVKEFQNILRLYRQKAIDPDLSEPLRKRYIDLADLHEESLDLLYDSSNAFIRSWKIIQRDRRIIREDLEYVSALKRIQDKRTLEAIGDVKVKWNDNIGRIKKAMDFDKEKIEEEKSGESATKLNGKRTRWYENGKRETLFTWKEGKLTAAEVWKPNGDKCPATKLDSNGNGVIVYYDEEGMEIYRMTFKDGNPVLAY